MSRSGTRSTNPVPACKQPAFVILMAKLTDWLGSRQKACEAAGVNSGHYTLVLQGKNQMSTWMAAKILAAYKTEKAKRTSAPKA